MDKIFKKNRWLGNTIGALMVIIGVIMIVIAAVNPADLTTVIGALFAVVFYAFSLICILYGLLGQKNKIVSTFLLIASVSIAIGTVFIVNKEMIPQIIVYFTGTFLLAFGATELMMAVISIATKGKKGNVVLNFIIFAVCVTCGVLIYVYRQDKAVQWTYIVTGIATVILGIITIFVNVKKSIQEKKEEPLENEDKEEKKKKKKEDRVEKPAEIEEKKNSTENDDVEVIDAE